jgi:type II secretory pathway pseudopilin PulG
MICGKQKPKGATLVEVSVVVAAFGLLVAFFAPTLPGVREQARIAKCLQNLRAITQAAGSYISENGTIVFAFPWDYHIDGVPTNHNLATEFIWGGGVPDRRQTDWDPSQGSFNPAQLRTDTYVITPANRPLNAYMSPGVWWSDPERVKGNSARYLRPMLLPDYFQCPSDSSAHLPMGGEGDPNLPQPDEAWFPTWQWWGTSYAIDWYWAYFYAADVHIPFVGWTDSPGLVDGPPHRQILESKQDRGASEWTLFYENRLNYALEAAVPRGYSPSETPRSLSGWHGEHDVHAAGFLDGSARYQYFDTRYVDGPGWTTWPNRPWDGTSWEPYQDY